MVPLRLLVVVVLVMLAGVAATPAQAIMRVESDGTNGLRLTDGNEALDHVTLELISTNSGLEWQVTRPRPGIELSAFDIRPGCRLVDSSHAACTRFSPKVTVSLLGANDSFAVGGTVPITDRLEVHGGTGNDIISGGLAGDLITGGSGDDRLAGLAGSDTLRAGPGTDTVLGDEGDDSLLGEDGPDRLIPGVGQDTADGGFGDDTFDLGTEVRDERDTVNGGIGRDTASYSSSPGRRTRIRLIEANLETIAGERDTDEQDVLRSVENYVGGLDEDILTGVLSSNDSSFNGGPDDDFIFGGSGPNTITGGAGADELDGNGGDDVIDAKAGEGKTATGDPVIECGDGLGDLAILDLLDDATTPDCENVSRSPAGEGPHVKIAVPRTLKAGGRRAALRLTCPKVLTKPCGGTLAIRAGARTSPRTDYSIRPGRARSVLVTLGPARVTRRTVGQIVSLERGLRGRKTTTRRVVLGP
jgi:Ca2+-binding RTX toxin-like protein